MVKRDLSEAGRLMGLKGGKRGGKATAANRTPAERREAARKAAMARWASVKESK